jgi:hypothetical protein
VDAISATDAWAVGTYRCPDGTRTLILHWDGSRWSKVESPSPSAINGLYGVSAESATDAWAVGVHESYKFYAHTLILHWDGTSWSKVYYKNHQLFESLFGVSAESGTDAWAVGDYLDGTTEVYRTLILRWDGSRWAKVKSPSPSSVNKQEGFGNGLSGVSADSATDAWAVGAYTDDTTKTMDTLILHWDGMRWSRV